MLSSGSFSWSESLWSWVWQWVGYGGEDCLAKKGEDIAPSADGRVRQAAADCRCCSSLPSASRSTSMVTGTSLSQLILWITSWVNGSDPGMGSDHLRNPHSDR